MLQKKNPKVVKYCKYQYAETCLIKGNSDSFRSNSNMCRECRKLYNKDYQLRKKQKNDPEFQADEEMEEYIKKITEEIEENKKNKIKI